MYTMTCTRLNISYALGVTSGHQSNASPNRRIAVKNILKYLNRTKDKVLVYGGQRRK